VFSRAAVITGCGAVSPLGVGVRALWEGLLAGRTAIAPITGFPADDLAPRTAAEVHHVARTDPDRAGAFALAAATEALADAALDPRALDAGRVGVVLGTTLGGMQLFERWMAGGEVLPAGIGAIPYYGPAVRLARTLGCLGPVATAQLACASGTHAIALAADWVRAGFNCLRATAEVARPFDAARRGLVLGEGAAIVLVEEAGHAAWRGARVSARVLGVGAAGDATHMTAPDREGGGAARALRAALAEAARPPDAVGFVSAHGTGTPYNDAMEAVAITRVFGRRAVPVNSIKGAIGHTLGAAGAFEAILCARVLAEGRIPPTAGLETPDPACDGLDLVVGTARAQAVEVAVSSSSGFAGTNAALVLGRA